MFFRFPDATAKGEANFWSALTCQRFSPWRPGATDPSTLRKPWPRQVATETKR